jgi:hypothetical protein
MKTLQGELQNAQLKLKAKNQESSQKKLNSDLAKNLKKEFLDPLVLSERLFSSDALKRYVDSFKELSEEQKDQKKIFFTRAKKIVAREIDKFPQKERGSKEMYAYIKSFLANKPIYSKIVKSIEIKNNDSKNMIELENKTMRVEKQSLDFDTEKESSTRFEGDEQYGWDDADKKKFDAEWDKVADEKYTKKTYTDELVDDPEAAALGGFDRNQNSRVTNVKKNMITENGNIDQKKSDLETSSQKETLDLRNDEEERLAQEVDRRKKEPTENIDKKNVIDHEKLKKNLDDARQHYAKLHYKNEDMVNKIKAAFGHFNTEQDNDVNAARDDYKKALMAYRNAQLGDMEQLSDEQKKERITELHALDVNEHIALYEDRVTIKAEQYPAIGKVALKAVELYKKVPTKYKIAFSAALLASGAIVGVGATAAGIFGTMAIGMRTLGAATAGMGATGWAETRAQKKEFAGIESAIEAFKNQDLQKQMAQLQQFDDVSFQQLEKAFHGKIAGRSRRVMAGVATMAGVMSVGAVAHALMADEVLQKDITNNNMTGTTPQEHMPDGAEALRMKAQMARDLAHQMGISDLDNLKTESVGGVPVEINGQPVPENFYTDEQRQRIDIARKADATMSGEQNLRTNVAKSDSHVIESGGTPDNMNEVYGESSPGDAEKSDNVPRYTKDELREAMKQSDASQLADNPEKSGWDARGAHIPESGDIAEFSGEDHVETATGNLSGIEMDASGIGTLSIEKGGSLEGSLIAFFTANSDRLTSGGMGWDPEKFKDVNEWAGKRAHGLVVEYMESHPGIDMDTVQPGTTFEIDLNNTADIRIKDIDFKGGPHIEATEQKIRFATQENTMAEERNISSHSSSQQFPGWNNPDAVSGTTQETANASEGKIIDSLRTKDEIIRAFDLTEKEYDLVRNEPAISYVEKVRNVPSDLRLPLDDYLVTLSEKDGVDLSQKTVGNILENVEINILDQEVAFDENAIIGSETIEKEHLTPSQEIALVSELSKDPDFNKAVADQIQQSYGMSPKNIGRAHVADFMQNDLTIQKKTESLIARAQEHLGEAVGAPRDKATIGSYFTRIFARAVHEDKVKDIFPTTDFKA